MPWAIPAYGKSKGKGASAEVYASTPYGKGASEVVAEEVNASAPYGKVKTCDNCGGRGHVAKECSTQKMCGACGAFDHIKAACPHAQKMCNLCGNFGHLQSKCFTSSSASGGKTCDNCGGQGHFSKACPSGKMCDACGSLDHMKAACPHAQKKCSLCGKIGHLQIKCYRFGAASGGYIGSQYGKGKGEEGGDMTCSDFLNKGICPRKDCRFSHGNEGGAVASKGKGKGKIGRGWNKGKGKGESDDTVCWDYVNKGTCSRKDCKFTHDGPLK